MNRRDRGNLLNHKVFLADVVTDNSPSRKRFRRASPCADGELLERSGGSNYCACWTQATSGVLPSLVCLVLTCPAIFSKVDVPKRTKMQIFLDWIQGSYRLGRYWPIPLETSMFTTNPPYLEFIEKDPLRLKTATTSFFVETFIMGYLAQRAAKQIHAADFICGGRR